MALMIDSVTPSAIPKGTPVCAGYIDGPYGPGDVFRSGWNADSWSQFPGSQMVTITVAGLAGARVYDIESGDGTPAQGAIWCRREIAAGRRPTLYFSIAFRGQINAALAAWLVPQSAVDFWCADYDGVAVIPSGYVAKQYKQNVSGLGGHWIDLSQTNNVWPATHPAPPLPPEPPMLAKPAVTIVDSPSNNGYWVFASDGGVFAYGDAGFYGSLGGDKLAAPIVGGHATSTGHGYRMVGSDGGVFCFGDAPYLGTPAGLTTVFRRAVAKVRRTAAPGWYSPAHGDGNRALADA